jgi:chromosome segregation ATPase
MTDALTRLQQKVDQHEREIEQIGLSTKEMVDGQKQVSKSIHELTVSLNRYIDRQEMASKQSDEFKDKQEKQAHQITQMREQMAANQPVLDGIRTINGKLIWLIISAMATPAVVLAYMTSKLGGA